jgi:NADH:ubiquinone oxidoreductase subunit 5 (subunit L)/multisubunit Na+/H+ antiporter MnhA subunit
MSDPWILTSALCSLICALLSLLYGCLYIIRFSTMKKMHKAAQWANEAQKTHNILWNVWVMLAMPAVWLAWSIILFIISIMSFVWRGTGTRADQDTAVQITEKDALAIRIGASVLLCIGIFYFVAMTRTFRRYGRQMDEEWQKNVKRWSRTNFLDEMEEAEEMEIPSDEETTHLEQWIVPEPTVPPTQ